MSGWMSARPRLAVYLGSVALSISPHSAVIASAQTLSVQESGTEALLQAVAPVDANVVWVSGHAGVVLRTVDGGATWMRVPAPAGDSLQYRDVHAFSATEAVILSAGTGPASRIYRTKDAGDTWELGYFMEAPAGFLDCMDFWDERGIAYGDAIDGHPFILVTQDGGATWGRPPLDGLLAAVEGEGGFAASGTCARTGTNGVAWIATGASGAARVLRTSDYGSTWTGVDAPVVRGDAAGLTTISFQPDGHSGVAFGGDLSNMDGATNNAIRSQDGGLTWESSQAPPFLGPVYGSTFVPGSRAIFVVGPAGAGYSADGGAAWTLLESTSSWAVGSAGSDATWLAGPQGRIVKVTIP